MSVEVRGLAAGATYTLRHDRVDEDHSNIASAWARLRDADQLARFEPDRVLTADAAGLVRVDAMLSLPSKSQLTLVPVEWARAAQGGSAGGSMPFSVPMPDVTVEPMTDNGTTRLYDDLARRLLDQRTVVLGSVLTRPWATGCARH